MGVSFLAVLAALVTEGALPAPTMPNPNFIVLADQLDEAEDDDFYCIDVEGTDVQPGNGLQAHTCKEPLNDELFETNAPLTSNIYASDHNLCVTAVSLTAGSDLTVEPCRATDTAQRWTSTTDGSIQSSIDTTLCWTVGEEQGVEAGAGGDHLARPITLELCSAIDTKYHAWLLPGGYVGRRAP